MQKGIIWSGMFKLNKKIKNYVFDYTIITDGFAVALRFLHKDYVEIEKARKLKMKLAKAVVNNRLKGLSNDDKITEKQKIKNEKDINRIKIQNERKIIRDKEAIKSENKVIKYISNDEPEFPYITDVNKEELKGKHIFIDPGKRSLLTMVDDNNNYLFYNNKEHMGRTKRLIYAEKLNKYKTELGIQIIENKLTDFNSKSCIVSKFKEYIKIKLEVNDKLLDLYSKVKFRQYKWYSFINKKRTEDNLLNKIESTYSKDHIIIIGDWSIGKQMANFISTPNLGIKRKLKSRFKVYNIDEYRTSCLNYKTEKYCENLYLPTHKTTNIEMKHKCCKKCRQCRYKYLKSVIPDYKEYKVHSILTFKMENNRVGCINRDKNACQNIKKLFNSFIKTGTIPERYRRGFKLEDKKEKQHKSIKPCSLLNLI